MKPANPKAATTGFKSLATKILTHESEKMSASLFSYYRLPGVILNRPGQVALVFLFGFVSPLVHLWALRPFVPEIDIVPFLAAAHAFVIAMFLPEQNNSWEEINNLRRTRFLSRLNVDCSIFRNQCHG